MGLQPDPRDCTEACRRCEHACRDLLDALKKETRRSGSQHQSALADVPGTDQHA